MKEKKITLNGVFLWYRQGATMVFARQLTPSEWLEEHQEDKTTTQILVGVEGSDGEDLIDLLNERERLRERVEELEHEENNRILKRIELLTNRIHELEKKQWWQFWK
jgi:hypothetical protein